MIPEPYTPLKLLEAGDPEPSTWLNSDSRSPWLLTADHAGYAVPRRLGDMGITQQQRKSHINYDRGTRGIAERLADLTGAPVCLGNYSRLVIDCNRQLYDPSLVPSISDGHHIPANEGLSSREVKARVEEIWKPYHRGLTQFLDAKQDKSHPVKLIMLHSMTDRLASNPSPRPWEISFLWNGDRKLCAHFIDFFRQQGFEVGDNEPYSGFAAEGYSIWEHGLAREIPSVLVEFRQDLVKSTKGQRTWADLFYMAIQSAED